MTALSTPTAKTLTRFDVRPIAGHIGAEIHGIDLSQPLDGSVVAEVKAILHEWKVVFFRDQNITQAQHIAFGACFGKVTPAHPTLPAAFDEHPEILLLDNERTAQINTSGSHRIDNRWHTDVTFVPNPPMGSILRGVVVPPYGGDTQFANTVAAYADLSPQLRAMLETLHAVHHNELPIERGEMPSEYAQQFMSSRIRSVHPVVRVHPETGERALFVNPNFTSHIFELSRLESRHLLAMLYEHMARPKYTCRFQWEPNSIAFWDNRATMHLGPSDVPAGMHRSMQRITIAGDVPVGVDGAASYALDAPAGATTFG